MSLQLEDFLASALEGYLSSDILLKNRSKDTLKRYFRELPIPKEDSAGVKIPSWIQNEALLGFAASHNSEEVRLLLSEEIEFSASSVGLGLSAAPVPPQEHNDSSSLREMYEPYQKALITLLNDGSISVASASGRALLKIVASVKDCSIKEATGHEVWRTFKSLWSVGLSGALVKDTNSPHPYRCMLRMGDVISSLSSSSAQQSAVLAMYDLAKDAFDSFFDAATLSVTADVLQFVNMLRFIEVCVINGLQVPQELQDLILQQLARPTSDDPFSALAKPQLLHFAGGCAKAYCGLGLKGKRSDAANPVKKWCESVVLQGISLAGGEEHAVRELREFLVPLLETLGAIGSSPNGHFFIRSVAGESGVSLLFTEMLRNCLKSKRTDLVEAALLCLQLLLEGHPKRAQEARNVASEESILDMETFVGAHVLSKDLFREVLWPLNKHFEPSVRQRLWQMLGPLLFWQSSDGGSTGNGVGKVALNVVGTWISGPENLEAETEVRTEQLTFMKILLNDIIPISLLQNDITSPQTRVLGVLRSKVEDEFNKGLYPQRQVLRTDAGVDH